jgi:DNA-binding FadR family transcriptional regulator
MAEHTGRPKYLELADALKRTIATGEYPVGSALPSTARLTDDFGVSTTVVRSAIRELRGQGLVVGQPGKAVYVRATPSELPAPTLEERLRDLEIFARGALEDLETRLTALERARPD